jgi:hypothetical protein
MALDPRASCSFLQVLVFQRALGLSLARPFSMTPSSSMEWGIIVSIFLLKNQKNAES